MIPSTFWLLVQNFLNNILNPVILSIESCCIQIVSHVVFTSHRQIKVQRKLIFNFSFLFWSPSFLRVIRLANYFEKLRSLWHHKQSKSFSCIKSHCGKRPIFFWICCWWIRVLWARNEWRTSVWIRNARHSCAIANVHYCTKRTKMFKMPSNADK